MIRWIPPPLSPLSGRLKFPPVAGGGCGGGDGEDAQGFLLPTTLHFADSGNKKNALHKHHFSAT